MTNASKFKKIVEEYNPNVQLLQGLDRYIVSATINQDKIQVFYSLWGVINELMIRKQLSYDDCLKEIIQIVQKANEVKKCDITYYFIEDLPNHELN